MITTQKHSINKVILTVDTNNKKTAFQLKDNLSVFLKQEIFPYLAKYFDDLVNDVPAEIIQIEELNLEINVAENQIFALLKNDIKSEIKKEIASKINNLIKEKKSTQLISIEDNKLKSFFYFLEEGLLPWWNQHQQKKSFAKEDLLALVKTTNFKKRFKEKIKNKVVQHRLINQFYNDELVLLCNQAFNQLKIEKELIRILATPQFSKLKNTLKKSVWLLVFEYFNTKNLKNTQHKLIEFVQIKKQQKETIASELLILETVVLNLIAIISNKQVSQSIDLQLINNLDISNTNTNTNTNINKHKIDAVKESTTAKKSINKNKTNENIKTDKPKIEKPLIKITNKENLKTNNELKVKDLENQQTPKGKIKIEKEKPSKIAEERSQEEVVMGQEDFTKSQEEIMMSEEEVAMSQEEIIMSEEEVVMSQEEVMMNEKEVMKSEEEAMMSQEENTISNKEDNSEEKNNVLKGNNNVNEAKEIVYVNELDPNTELPETITNSLLKNEETAEEIFIEDPKETYYIKNAGLILIHPYLKQFFENCDLLTDDGQINDKELAVHLLHYMATKEENQLESNLVFEKFLCGIPIKKTIDRKIKISKKLKDQTEELLKAVLQNWEVLRNSSPDLLRFEFLQRAGKLNLEKENPKIVVERKTQDILLDKIPWNIGICKIPWLPKLVFTDW